MADMSVLSSWYCEPENYDHPVIIVIDDMERCSGVILADFIRMLRYSSLLCKFYYHCSDVDGHQLYH